MGGNGNQQLLASFSCPGPVFGCTRERRACWRVKGCRFVRWSDFSLKRLSKSWPLGQWEQEHWRGRGLATNGTHAPCGVVFTSQGRTASYYPAVMLHQSFTKHLHWLITSFWYHIKQIITCSSNHVSTLISSLYKRQYLFKAFCRNFSWFLPWKDRFNFFPTDELCFFIALVTTQLWRETECGKRGNGLTHKRNKRRGSVRFWVKWLYLLPMGRKKNYCALEATQRKERACSNLA